MSNQLQRKLLELAGDSASITYSRSSEWNSTTFEGQRLTVNLLFTNATHGYNFMDSIREQGEDLVPLCGHTLCGLKVVDFDEIVPVGHLTVTVEALTLKD